MKTKDKPKSKILKRIILVIFLLGIICCDIVVYLLYGPWYGFRDWLITTAMTTLSHQYLATWFYSNQQIEECLNRNRIEELSGYTDENLINTINYNQTKIKSYKNEYERQILEKDSKNNDYKIIEIDGGKEYHGYMAVIYEPSRVKVATPNNPSNVDYLTEISNETNALIAINAGGFTPIFSEENTPHIVGKNTTLVPTGLTISNNKVISSGISNIIGFNKTNKLILGNFSSESAISNKIRDCISFGPYLILNSQKATIHGNGAWGKSCRTAIGQRADGIVLFLVLDADRTKFQGATMQDLIDIFERYGAVNAANLDGGSSSTMTCKSKTITELRGRTIPTAFILESDNSDDGDYSIVKDKINSH